MSRLERLTNRNRELLALSDAGHPIETIAAQFGLKASSAGTMASAIRAAKKLDDDIQLAYANWTGSVEEMPIEFLRLPARAYNALVIEGLPTVGSIRRVPHLGRIPGVWSASLAAIQRATGPTDDDVRRHIEDVSVPRCREQLEVWKRFDLDHARAA